MIVHMKEAAASHGGFMDIVVPNGKKLADCKGEYVRSRAAPGS